MYDEAVQFTKGRLFVAIPWLALAMPAFGQVSQASVRSYVLRPGVTITEYEGPKHEVCVLTISGPKTEAYVMGILDEVVPTASRGLALGALSECAGICRNIRDYEKVTIDVTVLYDGKLANPAAEVTFKSKSCEARVKEFRASPRALTGDKTN
jgi:hypothetical protein